MRIFTRYVLDELLYVFLFALAALTGLMVIGGVIREGISQNLPPGQLVRLIPYLLPQMLCITLPVTLLLSATSLYARMSGSNEIVAIKALGISPTAVVWPSMVLSFLLSLGAVWLNDVAMSWGRTGMQRVLVEAGEDIAYSMLRTQ
ncbi:MAG: LptF/LptG family permease, partial [Thermoguttaceae bacterium]|nr:LptF/LptG family permease [Thermoguttaceae bacterium]